MAYTCPVTLDGTELSLLEDGDGLEWRVHELKGWWDGTPTTVQQSQRIVSHGQFAERGHRTGRLVVVSGTVLAQTVSQAPLVSQARETIARLLADGGFGVLQTDEPTEGLRWADVQLFDGPTFDYVGTYDEYPMDLPYQLQLLAADPYKYGAVSSASTGFFSVPSGVGLVFPLFPSGVLDFSTSGVVSGIVPVSNPGTADAPVVFEVDGPTPVEGFNIVRQSDGQSITWLPGEEIPSGSSVVMDGTDGSVTIDGTADRRSSVLVDEWPVVPAGGSEDFLFSSNGADTAAVLTARVTATYW